MSQDLNQPSHLTTDAGSALDGTDYAAPLRSPDIDPQGTAFAQQLLASLLSQRQQSLSAGTGVGGTGAANVNALNLTTPPLSSPVGGLLSLALSGMANPQPGQAQGSPASDVGGTGGGGVSRQPGAGGNNYVIAAAAMDGTTGTAPPAQLHPHLAISESLYAANLRKLNLNPHLLALLTGAPVPAPAPAPTAPASSTGGTSSGGGGADAAGTPDKDKEKAAKAMGSAASSHGGLDSCTAKSVATTSDIDLDHDVMAAPEPETDAQVCVYSGLPVSLRHFRMFAGG
jgi:hypothetical protein